MSEVCKEKKHQWQGPWSLLRCRSGWRPLQNREKDSTHRWKDKLMGGNRRCRHGMNLNVLSQIANSLGRPVS